MLTQRMWVAAVLACGLAAQDGCAQGVPTDPGAPQVTPGAALSQDSSVDQVLDALDHRGQGLKDFSADVTLEEKDVALGDATVQKGTAVYQKKGEGDARMRVAFNSRQRGKKILDQKVEYLLDAGWLTERDYERKTEIRRQVARPGEKIDLLKLGQGPFPLPVGQSRESVLKLFDVTKVPAAPKGDPAGAVHVKLVPRDGTSFAKKFKAIDVWVDVKTEMPTRIRTLDVNETTERTTDLDIKGMNAGLKDGDFVLEPVPAGWDQRTEKYED